MEAYMVCRNPDKRTLNEFTRGLESLTNLEMSNPYLIDDASDSLQKSRSRFSFGYGTTPMKTLGNSTTALDDEDVDIIEVRGLLWDFYRSVILEFTCDELSQFFFWAAKARLCANPFAPLTAAGLAAEFYADVTGRVRKYGAIGCLRGSAPFVAAAFVHNFHHFEDLVKYYLSAVLPLRDVEETGLKRADRSEIPHLEDIHVYTYLNGLLLRASTRIFAHPLLLMAVRQVCDHGTTPFPVPGNSRGLTWARDKTWMMNAWEYYYEEGNISCFFRGLRSSLTSALVPISPFMMLGLAEIVLYRRILGHTGSGEPLALSGGSGRGGASVGTPSASIIHDIITKEGGYSSLLRYGYLTCLQLIPGFLSFVGFRGTLWFIFGSTKQRQRQRQWRLKRLKEFWGAQRTLNDNNRTASASMQVPSAIDATLTAVLTEEPAPAPAPATTTTTTTTTTTSAEVGGMDEASLRPSGSTLTDPESRGNSGDINTSLGGAPVPIVSFNDHEGTPGLPL